jgi:hypothetical protein
LLSFFFPRRFLFRFWEFQFMQVAGCVLLVGDNSRIFFKASLLM